MRYGSAFCLTPITRSGGILQPPGYPLCLSLRTMQGKSLKSLAVTSTHLERIVLQSPVKQTLVRPYKAPRHCFPPNYTLLPEFTRQYKLGAVLGSGAYASVHIAQRLSDGHQVAVKFIKIADDGSWSRHRKWGLVPRDVIFMDKVQHENIIKLIDVFRDDTYIYVVSTRADNCSNDHGSNAKHRYKSCSVMYGSLGTTKRTNLSLVLAVVLYQTFFASSLLVTRFKGSTSKQRRTIGITDSISAVLVRSSPYFSTRDFMPSRIISSFLNGQRIPDTIVYRTTPNAHTSPRAG